MRRRLPIPALRWSVSRAHLSQASISTAERYLGALHQELVTLGVPSTIVTSAFWPRLRLRRRYTGWDADGDFEGHLLAANPGTGWSYWWPWIQEIGPASDPAAAAAIIADELGVEMPADDTQTRRA